MERLNYIVIRLLMAFLVLAAVTPLSNAYDFLGPVMEREFPDILPEPQVEVPEVEFDPSYVTNIAYPSKPGGFDVSMGLLPTNNSQFIVVYGTDKCVYCDRLMKTLKENNKDFTLVYVYCNRAVRGLFSNRVFTAFPSFEVIQDGKLKGYGVGAYNWNYFKQFEKE